MNDYIKVRRLAFKYKELSLIKDIIIKRLENKKVSHRLFKKRNEITSFRDLRRLFNYIELYEVIFERSLNMLESSEDREITVNLCKKGASVEKTALTFYVSPSAVERAFKRFNLYFLNNLSASRRIIKPLSEIKKL